MRILYLVPGNLSDSLGAQELTRRLSVLNGFAAPDTIVEIQENAEGPSSVESLYEEYLSVPGTLEIIRTAPSLGFDGLIVGCFGDPGVHAARELVQIPVVGPAEFAMLLACTLGHRFSILTVLDSLVVPLTYLAKRAGVSEKLASVRSVNVPVLELAGERHLTIESLIAMGKRAVSEDGADTLVLGCMTMGFLGAQAEISESVGVPVVNPVYAATKLLEVLCAAGLSHSKLAYPTPRKLRAQTVSA